MSALEGPGNGYVPVADLAIDSVTPSPSGFVLRGRGDDRAEYQLDMHLDLPVDRRTRAVLGELLSQSEWRVWRKAPEPFRPGAPVRSKKPVS
ncbi:MAG: hypothetical protein ACE5PT_10470 [Gemmatimonadales bacterium]